MALKTKSFDSQSNELNFIGSGTSVEGNIETKGSLRIDGKVKGTVKSGDTLTVGTNGEIIGEVFVKNAIIGGRIEGNLVVEEKLILESTSYLNGNLRSNKLIIDEGAYFSGESEMASKHSIQKNSSKGKENQEETPTLSKESVTSEAIPK
jgi:cytoskeletal protein CcmA (bactofilin family)